MIRARSYRGKHNCVFVPDVVACADVREARRAETNARFTSPLAIGLTLTLLPPVAVALVWFSPNYKQAARIAVTIYGLLAFVAMLLAVVATLHG